MHSNVCIFKINFKKTIYRGFAANSPAYKIDQQ